MQKVEVIICAYTLRRWARLQASVESALAQPAASRVLLVVDHNLELLRLAKSKWAAESRVAVLANERAQGLSGARNTGVAHAERELVAFLDDDAVALPGWLDSLAAVMVEPKVLASGGRAEPEWPAGKPGKWLPVEALWVVGCSFTGQPTEISQVRNVMGCSMLFRRSAILAAGGFNEQTGRVGTVPLGAEETDLCIRMQQQTPGAKVLFVPASGVHHEVSSDRLTFKYLVRRGWYEGISKAYITAQQPKGVLGTERGYALMLLAHTVKYLLRGKIAHSIALPALLSATVAGYGCGMLKFRRGSTTPTPEVAF